MRPYLVLTVVVLIAVATFAEQPVPRPMYGSCFYGCGPFIPMVTTPEVSLEQVSPNPVGASNATTGLVAGATNGTLSQVEGSTSSVYTEAVWYQGGAPLITPEVHVLPEPMGHEAHRMHDGMREERIEERREVRKEEHGEERAGWTYFTGREHTADAAQASGAAKGSAKAARVYTNDDVTRQNDKNGNVKYDGKTEKI